MSSTRGEMLVAAESFSGTLDDGTEVTVRRGVDFVRESNPVAQKWPQYFKPIESRFDGIEDATRDPGTKRGAR